MAKKIQFYSVSASQLRYICEMATSVARISDEIG